MSDFSLTLVLQIKTSKNHQWHGKGKHKIWENHSFWRNISRERAILTFCGSGNRQGPGTSVHIVQLSKREIVGSLLHIPEHTRSHYDNKLTIQSDFPTAKSHFFLYWPKFCFIDQRLSMFFRNFAAEILYLYCIYFNYP